MRHTEYDTMIRVYSPNFTKSDYEKLAKVFANGFASIAPVSNCSLVFSCSNCEHHRICEALVKAIDYCNYKAAEMVEP